ncbi:hypothetical protein SERLADRAFT_404509 [Serpula lacrymans var. lacrymans S7.9]|uniref:Uncharacterized protein n=1 Tax=Serpula lacrymans var. lacrymans (strain S7.9) TaxID=578457 RepID=F8NDL5_SERL9|nr:uncharacterized protein SERLADRAFT_404509 [Serpula lacrymans var. lacrymans S7.9]EGO30248.1 hypothetical protein SERLADRAFT_404509 [Serpula lacrymans var. lacrymans S7.9]
MVCQELFHQQVMSYLVGGGDCYSSHAFKLLRWYEFDRYVRKELHEETPDITSGNNNFQNEDYHAIDETDTVDNSVRRDQIKDLQGEQAFLLIHAADSGMEGKRFRKQIVIANMNVKNECKDACNANSLRISLLDVKVDNLNGFYTEVQTATMAHNTHDSVHGVP